SELGFFHCRVMSVSLLADATKPPVATGVLLQCNITALCLPHAARLTTSVRGSKIGLLLYFFRATPQQFQRGQEQDGHDDQQGGHGQDGGIDRKSTRLNSSHVKISYAVFCLKKKK